MPKTKGPTKKRHWREYSKEELQALTPKALHELRSRTEPVAPRPPRKKVSPKPKLDPSTRAHRGLLSAARYLHDEAMRDRDGLSIGLARAADALWLALDRKARSVADASLGPLAKSFDRAASAYLEDRTRAERWTGERLPARAKVDRHERLLDVYEFTKQLAFKAVAKHPKNAAKMMVSRLAIANVDVAERVDDTSAERALLREIERRLQPGWSVKFDEGALLVESLVAIGVARPDAHNWVQSVVATLPSRRR